MNSWSFWEEKVECSSQLSVKWLIILEEFYIWNMPPKLINKSRKMSAYHQLDLEPLGYRPNIVFGNLPRTLKEF
jgi:hypothetical protein